MNLNDNDIKEGIRILFAAMIVLLGIELIKFGLTI
jgi:hypothetical protein